MEIGKLAVEDLEKLVSGKRTSNRRDILQGSKIGEDCGAISFAGEICVVSTDPITATQQNLGFLAVHVACNDVYACGAVCVGILVTVLAPPAASLEDIAQVMDDIYENCALLNIEVIGGHTEVTDAVNRLLVSVTAVGKTQAFVSSGGAKPGDDLLLTKYCGLEGTHILISDFADELQSVLTPEEMKQGKALIHQLSIAKDSLLAVQSGCHAMHDVTDGGLLGALYEMLECSGCGVILDERNVPLLELTKKICSHYHLNPFRLIGSGSLLVCTPKGDRLLNAYRQAGIPAAKIGTITEDEKTVIDQQGNKNPLAYVPGDQLYQVYHGERERSSCEV